MKSLKSTLLAALLTGLVSVPASQAAVITWQTPSAINVTQPSQVLNTGNVYSAAFNNPYTVNSVAFNIPPSTFGANGSGNNYAPTIPGADASYRAIVNYGQYRASGANATLTLSGLTSGQDYQLQVFTPYWNTNYETKLISGANTVAMGNTGSAPTYVLGLFTADATTQTFQFTANTGSSYGLLAAVNVVAVPEPSTWAMLLLAGGLTSMVVLRRRRMA